ncbi:MAG: hypothetical protein OXT01_19675, partial [Rhodospirillaceae bacterium]|nr:hypothetical protein [Rhodospirillaceae bacterium]
AQITGDRGDVADLRGGDFADASVAVNLSWDGAKLAAARISLGAVAPLPVRAIQTEAALLAGDLSETAIHAAARMTVEGALPLSDNAYKARLLVNLTERAIKNSLPE